MWWCPEVQLIGICFGDVTGNEDRRIGLNAQEWKIRARVCRLDNLPVCGGSFLLLAPRGECFLERILSTCFRCYGAFDGLAKTDLQSPDGVVSAKELFDDDFGIPMSIDRMIEAECERFVGAEILAIDMDRPT